MGFGTMFAPRYTRVTASQTAAQIASAGTINVFSILIESTANSQVTLLQGDGTTVIATPRVLANDTLELCGFYAHSGLCVTTPASTTVTVWHSQPHA